ncbi:LacI family DNA-binding transcriptional regulator [Agrococcus terreus]|uniref:Transcriptional regulator n=1 Tax=Agrococcus terreus TaxID=574649 RepID=A0ABQ2KFM0_9MICO|nr:LacI family DNA-binding transcriptional regulator [Agrococcus terreus]GGN79547.1 transcriptional regulator [Agrococcus terreus]
MAGTERARASIRDVAQAAQVSAMTVSRVLNGHPSIRPATRERVLQAMARLDYTPNRAARALATRRSDRIGVIVDSAVEYGPASTLRGIEEAAHAAGYAVAAVSIGGARASDATAAVDHALAQGVDALLLIAPRASSIGLLRAAHRGVPAVVLSSHAEDDFPTAGVDQAAGARLAVEHLLALGHRRIVHAAGPDDWLDATARTEAYRAAMAAAGLEPEVAQLDAWTADAGYAFAAGAELDRGAVFAANDQIALGILHGLGERGVRVPEDVSIVGFDDIPESRHFTPPLTTVRQDFAELGERAVAAVVAALRGDGATSVAPIAPTLVVRASTAGAAAA